MIDARAEALTHHTRFSAEELDAEYSLRDRRTRYETTIMPAWACASETARAELPCALDVRYGPGARQTLDVFPCGQSDAPTLVYFHGGYWQRGDKALYSFLARPFTAHGVNVVLIGYDLCPAVTLTRIVAEARDAMVFLWREAERLGLDRTRFTAVGHSAGGHLTQMMMAVDWPGIAADLPSDVVTAGLPISPLSYLEPVRLTEAINAAVGMDAEEAHAQSPMTTHPPVTTAPQLVAVGGAESREFQRQARMYVEAYATEAREVSLHVVPDADHFEIINALSDPCSPFFAAALSLIRG